MSQLRSLAGQLRAAAASFEPGVFSGRECAALAEALAATEKACAAARVRAATRAAECGAHRERGFVDAADWMARSTGTSVSDARAMLETVLAVEQCPETRDALVSGELSAAQAREIVRTEAVAPGSEGELLQLARHAGLAALRDAARRRRVASIDREELQREQRRRREVRHWIDDELGMICGRFALPPADGIPFVNRLDALTDVVRREARRTGSAGSAGSAELRAAHAADALLRMLEGSASNPASPRPRPRSADLVLVCDLVAYRRGHTIGDELSHIVGGGPVPVSTIRDLAHDAFLKVVFHDGAKIDTVAHLGRHIPTELRTALELGSLPGLDGTACVEDGCGRRYGLEWDHVDPVANGGITSYDNLQARCQPHHREKTERDRNAGLLGAEVDERALLDRPAVRRGVRHVARDDPAGHRCRRPRAA